jgi:predicted TIM-barrel fold metal-dependent hydrolase
MPRAIWRMLERRSEPPRLVMRDGMRFVEYGPGSVVAESVFAGPDEILARMDEAGVDRAVLSVNIPGVDWLDAREAEHVASEANAETATLAARHPDRFSGLATLPMQSPELAIRVLEHALEDGLCGAMIYSNVAGEHLDAEPRRAFFDAAARMNAAIMLHPTYPLCAPSVMTAGMMEIAGFLFDTTTAALRLVFDGLYDRNPDFKFLVPHAGGLIPYFVGRIDFLAQRRPGSNGNLRDAPSNHIKRFYVDTVSDWAPALRICRELFGIDRIMYGTDHPFWPMQAGRPVLDRLELSAADRARIEHLNAEAFFGIPAEPKAS